MKSVINFTKGMMNKDLDERLVPKGAYVNGKNIRTGSSESTEIGSVEKAGGNNIVTTVYFDPVNQTNLLNPKCIGAFKDDVGEVIYWFIADVDQSYISGQVNLVVSFNTKTQALRYHIIDDKNILNFSNDYPITGVSLIENLLYWTDGLNPPRRINVNSSYTGLMTEEPFNLIVTPPSSAPAISLTFISNQGNFLEENFISFAYRYKYADGEYSALSQFSDIAFLPKDFVVDSTSYLNEGMLNQYNAVNINYFSGGSLVKEIELCYKKADSNEIYLIQKINKQKESILDNVTVSFLFSNNKIYSALPSTEWFRLYDNVPHKAKALSIMGNRLMLGNYTEGYDMVSSDDYPVNINFGCQALSEEITSEKLTTPAPTPYTYPLSWSTSAPQTTVNGAKFRINIPTAYQTNIPSGLYIGFEITLESATINGIAAGLINPYPQAPFTLSFNFTTQKTYPTFNSLLMSVEFQQKLGTISAYYQSANGLPCSGGFSLTDYFACSISDKPTSPPFATHAVGSTSTPKTGFTITSPIGQNVYFEIAVPAMAYYNGTSYAYEYFRVRSISAELNKTGAPKSLHSNRDYQVGIVYMDDYNRSTPSLTSNLNTVFFPSSTSINRNRIKVTIPVSQKPPKWATRYKFVAKSTKERYETIYTNIFFDDPTDQGIWIKLDGESQNKVNVGDRLIVKSDSGGPVRDLVTTVVLEKEVKPANWISANTINNQQILEPSGAYMRVKLDGWSANYDPKSYIDTGFLVAESTDDDPGSEGAYAHLRIPCFYSTPATPVERWTIPAGSTVLLSFRFVRNGKNCGGSSNSCGETVTVYSSKFVASRNYNDLYEFWLGEGVNVGASVYPISLTCPDDAPISNSVFNATLGVGQGAYSIRTQGINRYQFFQDTAAGGSTTPLYLTLRQGAPACGGFAGIGLRKGIIEARIIIQKTGDNLIFETEPTNAIPNVYYENHESFAITAGNHMCNNVNQAIGSGIAGVSTLDFYNCYSFGNGVESFKIKDSITGSYFLLGQRVTAAIESQFKQTNRFSDITYSGVYNRETNVNKLNEFNLGLSNYKLLEAMYGSIQRMHPRQTDLLVFQEDKVSRVLVGKNILSDLSGGNALVSVPEVLGNQIARVEEYGISENPESFASFGGDIYFTDSKRGAVLKLSGEQLAVISSVGMQDYFRSTLGTVKRAPIRGGYDPYNKDYVLSIGDEPAGEIVFIDCGSETWIQEVEVPPVTYRINVGSAIGTVTLQISNAMADVPYICYYNGVSVDTGTTGGNPSISVNKNIETVTYIDLVIYGTFTGGGFLLTAPCPTGNPITVIVAVLTSNDDAGKVIDGIHWGVYPNHIMSDSLTVQSGAYPVLGKYQVIPSSIGNGIVPPNGGNIRMFTTQSQFNTINRFPRYLFLRSNTLYALNTVAGLNSFIAATTIDSGTATTQFAPYPAEELTKSIGSAGAYLYLVWDYRIIGNANLCDTVTLAAACCDCTTACATSVELQTSGVFASSAQACVAAVENLIISLYYSGGGVNITKTFYFDLQQTLTAYPGVYKYYDSGAFRWLELNSLGKVINTGNC
jgi:hypothetical protein